MADSPCGASSWPPDGPDLAGLSSAAEELISAIRLEPGNVDSTRHLKRLKNFAGSRIDSPQVALFTFPGGVPQFSLDPSDPGDETIGLDGAKDGPCIGVDLIDLPVAILSNPERPFGLGKARVAASSRRWDRGKHLTCLWIDLLNAIFGDLKQMLAVEGRSCVCGNIYRPHCLPARRVEGI